MKWINSTQGWDEIKYKKNEKFKNNLFARLSSTEWFFLFIKLLENARPLIPIQFLRGNKYIGNSLNTREIKKTIKKKSCFNYINNTWNNKNKNKKKNKKYTHLELNHTREDVAIRVFEEGEEGIDKSIIRCDNEFEHIHCGLKPFLHTRSIAEKKEKKKKLIRTITILIK